MSKEIDNEKLLQLKKRIDNAKETKARLNGQLESAMKRLRDLGFKNVAAAEKKLAEMREEIAELDDKIEAGVTKLKKYFPELA